MEAVLHREGPLLVLAGAGSGKTKVITSRYAYSIKELGISPSSILAVTFTNKAAEEMKSRIRGMTGISDLPWVHTFHSVAVKILRAEINHFGISGQFVIYDKGDQLALIRECVRELNLSEELYPVKTIAGRISELKNSLITPERFAEKAQSFGLQDKISRVYPLYRDKLRAHQALDFDDLLMILVQLFQKFPEVLKRYQARFASLMVDEYQDTNSAQYQIISLLCGGNRNICCVGDDDQSIYGFRGADVENILRFEKDFPDARVIKLEQNYRSTKTILEAANRVIEKNSRRKVKKLWTDNLAGDFIELFRLESDEDEADLISRTILSLSKERNKQGSGFPRPSAGFGGIRGIHEVKPDGPLNINEEAFQKFSILYRTHIQSRPLEESFQKHGIPYVIVGGLRFFERKEIKDILSYLRVISDPLDEVNLKRIINVPVRGIGAQTIEKLAQFSAEQKCPLYEALEKIQGAGILPARAEKSIAPFSLLIKELALKKESSTLLELVQAILDRTGYLEELKKEKLTEKIENIYEFFSSVTEFQEKNNSSDLISFLDYIALFSDESDEKQRGRVRMMTLHSAKGLEFPIVFLPGMEEGIFPHSRALVDNREMEEERRLCYVGITRAREKLFLTSARSRRMYGSVQFNAPSRFIDDIPIELVAKKELNIISKYAGFVPQGVRKFEDKKPSGKHLNQAVTHPLWGRGIILSTEGEGDDMKMTIRFDSAGTKKMASKYANLQFINR